jgi:hypothetical protein
MFTITNNQNDSYQKLYDSFIKKYDSLNMNISNKHLNIVMTTDEKLNNFTWKIKDKIGDNIDIFQLFKCEHGYLSIFDMILNKISFARLNSGFTQINLENRGDNNKLKFSIYNYYRQYNNDLINISINGEKSETFKTYMGRHRYFEEPQQKQIDKYIKNIDTSFITTIITLYQGQKESKHFGKLLGGDKSNRTTNYSPIVDFSNKSYIRTYFYGGSAQEESNLKNKMVFNYLLMDMIDTYQNLENMSHSEKQAFFKSLQSVLKECKEHNIEIDPFLNIIFYYQVEYLRSLDYINKLKLFGSKYLHFFMENNIIDSKIPLYRTLDFTDTYISILNETVITLKNEEKNEEKIIEYMNNSLLTILDLLDNHYKYINIPLFMSNVHKLFKTFHKISKKIIPLDIELFEYPVLKRDSVKEEKQKKLNLEKEMYQKLKTILKPEELIYDNPIHTNLLPLMPPTHESKQNTRNITQKNTIGINLTGINLTGNNLTRARRTIGGKGISHKIANKTINHHRRRFKARTKKIERL